MKKITQKELDIILRDHELWLKDNTKGKRAILDKYDFRKMILKDKNFKKAILCWSNFQAAVLDNSDFSEADLRYCNLCDTDCKGTNFSKAFLRFTIFGEADLRKANFTEAILDYTIFTESNMRGAITKGAKITDKTAFFGLQCPEEGAFIGFKRCRASKESKEDRIVKLLIMEDSLRLSSTNRRCRASKVKVLSVESLDGEEKFDSAISKRDHELKYIVGEIIEVKNFNKERWSDCAEGIHFYITRYEAETSFIPFDFIFD